MTISASTIFQIQSTATSGNVNGGGFNPANTNGITDGVIASGTGNSPTLQSNTYSFADADDNHWIYFPTQAGITSGWYQIASQSGGTATLKAAIGQAQIVTNNKFGTNTVAGVGSASASGVTFLVDYSQTDSSRYTSTTLTGTTTSATDAGGNPFTAQMVGNFICAASGTGLTAGWTEIVSVSGGTATLSNSLGASYSSVHAKIGGAVSLGGSTTGITDAIFFALGSSSATAGNRFFIKGGTNITYSPSSSVTAVAGNAAWPSIVEGYASVRGDRPTGATRPTLSFGSNGWTSGANNDVYSIIFTGSPSNLVTLGTASKFFWCKATNSITSANHAAFQAVNNCYLFGCEAICYRGKGIQNGSGSGLYVQACYIHDSDVGINFTNTSNEVSCSDNIIACNVTDAIQISGANAVHSQIMNNTLYGAENKLGTGVSFATGTTNTRLINNIIYGFATGVSHADTQTVGYDNFNDYFNNTADVSAATQWQKGNSDVAINPNFVNVQQITGSTATTTSGNHLVQSGATFVSSGVVAGRDFLYIKSGTGVTAGIYGIASVDSETQITTDISLSADATANKVWQITTGRNFATGSAINNLAYPGTFPAATTTAQLGIGAVQGQGNPAFTFGG